VTTKPPWDCTDKDRWLAYVDERFDDEGHDPTEYEAVLRAAAELVRWHPKDQRDVFHRLAVSAAKQQAHCGNLEPLRKLVPGAEDCIREPPFTERGQTRLQRRQAVHQERLARAAVEMDCIRKILRRDFPNQSRRGITQKAVELAARRYGVDANDLAEAMRRGTKRA
jgi:hypothetical protein